MRNDQRESTPARAVIHLLGGTDVVAEILGRSPSQVQRYMQSDGRRGVSDGLFPVGIQMALLEHAIEHRIPLRLEMFFPPDLVARLDAMRAEIALNGGGAA